MRIFSKPRQVAQDPRRGNVEAGEPVLRISAPLPRQIHDEDAVALGIGYFRPMLPTDPKSPLLNIKVTRQAIWVLNADNTLYARVGWEEATSAQKDAHKPVWTLLPTPGPAHSFYGLRFELWPEVRPDVAVCAGLRRPSW